MSISLADATPSASILIASFPRTTPNLLVANPGTSFTSIVVLPIDSPTFLEIVTVCSDVSPCLTISSNGISGTGLKKCKPTNLPEFSISAAISEIDRPEVFVARTDSFGANPSNSRKTDFFSSILSGTASIIRSIPLEASSMSGEVRRLAFHDETSTSLVLPFSMPLFQKLSMLSSPFFRDSGNAS